MNIFNIGKANARITELETELAAHKENQTAIEKAAEGFKAEAKAAQDALAAEKAATAKALSDFTAANDKSTKAQTDLKAAQDAQADFDKKLEVAASAKAGAIVAEIGHKPLAEGSKSQGDDKPDFSKLTGLDKVIAIEKYESAQRAQNKK